MDAPIHDLALARFLQVLRTELELLEELSYRHQACLLLLGIGDATHLGLALDELADVEDRLAVHELIRTAATAELASRWSLDPVTARLRDVVARAADEERGELIRLGDLLRERTQEVAQRRAVVAELAAAQLAVVENRMDRVLAGPVVAYDASGDAVASPAWSQSTRL